MIKKVLEFVSKVHWGAGTTLSESEKQDVRGLLKDGYYIILTRHNNYLTTYIISFASMLLTGKLGYWAHALMNVEDEVKTDNDYRIIQATGKGVGYASFDETFDVNSIAILKPKKMSVEHWTLILERAAEDLGKPYDSLVQLNDNREINCVELVRNALMAEPNYEIDFANFEAMIKKSYNLSPQMFYECPDFEVVYEIRH